MPFEKRSSFLNETVRNHPVTMATTAATGGVLLGAFVMFQVFAAPHPRAEGTAQAAVETKVAEKPQAETTGSALAGENDVSKTASADCDQQTWPYLSRACIEETRAKNRNTRVVSTDRVEKPAASATETPAPDAKNNASLPAPSPWAPAVSSTTPAVAPAIATAASRQAAPAVGVTPPPAVEATATAAQAAPQMAAGEAKYAASARAAQDRRAAKKAKRKPRSSEQAVAERNMDGDDEVSAASVEREYRAGRRADRRRIVERLNERHYDVAEEDGGGRRRIIVIRRGGGSFESLFGMGRRGDDD